jgi:serine/threonine-protein kinase RsbW
MASEAQLQLLSRFENIELAERMLNEVGRSSGVDEELLYWAGMALREALANAIKHGNKLSPSKRVHVHILVSPKEVLHITVEDEGEGFNPASLGDPTSPQNLLRESGRGVFYMRNFMDEVRFATAEGGGTRIELVKRMNSRRAK